MKRLSELWTAHAVEPSHFVRRALLHMRWGVLAGLLLVALLIPPRAGRAGIPTWILLALFAAYALLYDVLGRGLPRRRFFRGMALLDLPLAGLVYALGTVPGSLPFVLLLLAVVCAAVTMSPRGALLYTGVAIVLVAVVNPTLHYWSPLTGDLQEMGSELIVLGLVGGGTAVLARRLALEHRAAEAGRGEATRLADLDRQRAAFIATVSHDVQTPLTALRAGLGFVEMGAGAALSPDVRELLAASRRNVDRLRLQIDNLLAASRLDAGAIRPERVALDLRTLALEALAMVRPLFVEKGQVAEADLPTALPITGDPRLLEEALINLLANAHRHTPAGARVTVWGQVAGDEVRLVVSDNGPGIPAAEREAIFERFHHGVGGGTGLGLAIVRAVVELHRGHVWAESPRDGGAAFHVILPAGDTPLSVDDARGLA
ncbi:MAG: ATP-binding protein [Chloroflexota bacterium]|nr:ATP-binding protein [Chloroflexota bacterium]